MGIGYGLTGIGMGIVVWWGGLGCRLGVRGNDGVIVLVEGERGLLGGVFGLVGVRSLNLEEIGYFINV